MKTVLIEKFTEKERYENNAYIVRLQRINKDISQLQHKMCSYTCEPQTYGLFDQFELLKFRMADLKRGNEKIIDSIKRGDEPFEMQSDQIRVQFIEFKNVKQAVDRYMEGVKNC